MVERLGIDWFGDGDRVCLKEKGLGFVRREWLGVDLLRGRARLFVSFRRQMQVIVLRDFKTRMPVVLYVMTILMVIDWVQHKWQDFREMV